MGNLPKRDDKIYKEIESFKDYELTQCVAYEMAIRRSDNDFSMIPLWEIEKSSNYELSDINLFGFCNLANKVTSFYPTYVEETEKNAFNIFREKPQFKHFDEEDLKTHFQQSKKFWFNKIANNLEYFIENFLMNENKKFIPLIIPTMLEDINVDRTLLIEIIEHTNLIKSHQLLKYSRPKITSHLSKEIDITINLGLSLPELIAQITEIKNKFDNEIAIAKTPTELLGTTLKEATPQKDYPKKPTATKMADMFYVYDYIKARLNAIKEYNIATEENYQENLQTIKNNHDLSKKEKTIQKNTLHNEYLENIIDTKITDIFAEDELTKVLDMTSNNISKMYYSIKPYIDDCKYKELVTGVSTLE